MPLQLEAVQLPFGAVYNRQGAAHLQLSCSPQQLAGLARKHGAHYELDARQKGQELLSWVLERAAAAAREPVSVLPRRRCCRCGGRGSCSGSGRDQSEVRSRGDREAVRGANNAESLPCRPCVRRHRAVSLTVFGDRRKAATPRDWEHNSITRHWPCHSVAPRMACRSVCRTDTLSESSADSSARQL